MNLLPIIVGIVAAAGVWLVAAGFRSSQAGDATMLARQRLARQELGLGQSAIALELEKPLGERLTAPVRRWLTRQMNRVTPAAQAATFQRELDFAAFLVGIFLLVGVAIGFYLPVLWLDQLVRERRAEIEAALPNALEVVAISMEAGLGLDRALEQLVRHQEGPLTLLVARALREMELGRPRGDALIEMAEATEVEDFTALVRSILHAERTGVPIARTIAAHAAQMRVKRRLKIRVEAARASLKILLPTVGCVFPTLWLILLGPALLVVLSIASHK